MKKRVAGHVALHKVARFIINLWMRRAESVGQKNCLRLVWDESLWRVSRGAVFYIVCRLPVRPWAFFLRDVVLAERSVKH